MSSVEAEIELGLFTSKEATGPERIPEPAGEEAIPERLWISAPADAADSRQAGNEIG